MSGIVDELGHLAELLGDALDELPLLLRRRLVRANNEALSRRAATSRLMRSPDSGWVLRSAHSNGAAIMK